MRREMNIDGFLAKVDKYLKENLTTERYEHTYRVQEVAMKLARKYDVSINKAKVAALFHDCVKDFDKKKKRRLAKQNFIILDDHMLRNIELAHGVIASSIAYEKFEIFDEDVLAAIKFHTTGRNDMSDIEKIIFIADAIEPHRDLPEEFNNILEVALEDLSKATVMILKYKLRTLMAKKVEVHPFTFRAINFLTDSYVY